MIGTTLDVFSGWDSTLGTARHPASPPRPRQAVVVVGLPNVTTYWSSTPTYHTTLCLKKQRTRLFDHDFHKCIDPIFKIISLAGNFVHIRIYR